MKHTLTHLVHVNVSRLPARTSLAVALLFVGGCVKAGSAPPAEPTASSGDVGADPDASSLPVIAEAEPSEGGDVPAPEPAPPQIDDEADSGSTEGDRRRIPRVRQAAEADVVGTLAKDIIRGVARANFNEVRRCYNAGLAEDPDLEGTISVKFQIDAAGKVSSSSVAADELGDGAVGVCIAAAIKTWKFPKEKGRAPVVVTFPFGVSPG